MSRNRHDGFRLTLECSAMGQIEDISRETLKSAHTDLLKSRRTLMLAAGLLALIHLLTVHPYLKTAREIADIEASMQANAALEARLEPEIARLRAVSETTGFQLDSLLSETTARMIGNFATLRSLVQMALQGQVPEAGPAGGSIVTLPQMPAPQMQQMQQMEAPNMPPPEVRRAAQWPQDLPGDPDFPETVSMPSPESLGPGLRPILLAIAADEKDAYDRLIDFARRGIVEAAYVRAQEAWDDSIRPAYLRALAETEAATLRTAEAVPETDAATAQALRTAADELARQQAVIARIEIRHDDQVDAALGSDWWHTVGGKGVYADAVAASISGQMDEIARTAAAPADAIGAAMALQEALRNDLQERQTRLEQQFADQRSQLAALSGLSGAMPVDLASFIGLFPLVLGVTMGLLLLRAGQTRREAASAAADLAKAAPEDRETRHWLVHRTLGGPDAGRAAMVTAATAAGMALWIVLAAMQLADSATPAPLSPWASAALGVLTVAAAAARDIAAVRALAAATRQ